jgi:hypothetical protein
MAFDARAALRLLAVLMVSAVALGSALAAVVVVRSPHASVGFALNGLTVRGVAPHSAAAEAGLRSGDVLAPGTSTAARLRALWYDAYAPAQTEQITFTHDGATKTVLLRAREHAAPFNSATRAVLDLRLLAYVFFILTGAALVLLHPARFTWAFFACCVGLANFPAYVGWSLTAVSPPLGTAAFLLWTALADVASVAFLAFALRFPSDSVAGWRRIAWRTLPLWLAAFLAFDVWNLRATYEGTPVPDAFVRAADAAGLVVWALGAASLAGTYRSAARAERRRLQWAIGGTVAGALAWYVERVLAHGGYPLIGHIVGIATVTMPLSLAYATLKHRVVDVRFVLNRALAYSILGSGVAALFALSAWFLATTLQREGVQIALQVLLALVVGAWLYRTHRSVETWLEAALFRRLRRAQDVLREAAGAAPAAPSLDALEAALAEAAVSALDLESAALYRRGPGGAFVRTAASGSANAQPAARASLECGAGAFAVAGDDGDDDAPLALLVCGPHRSGYALDADEAALIARFVAGVSPLYRRLARRTASAGVLSALVRDPAVFGDAAFGAALGAHIATQLGPEDRGVLEWSALVPRARLDDIAALAGAGGAARLLDLASSTAFVERTAGGVFVVCPLLRPVLARGAGAAALRALALRAATCAAGGDPLRAAEIAAAADDRGAALAWLERARAQETLPPALDALLASAAPHEFAGRPALALARARRAWLLEAEPAMRAAASASLEGADAATRSALAAWIAFSLAESGELARADRALAAAGERGTAVAALIAAKRGRLGECERLARDAERDGAALAAQVVRAIALERPAGRWGAARALLAAAFATARTAQETLLVLAETAFLEWLCGDDDAARTLAREMLHQSAQSGVRTLDGVAHAILGEPSAFSETVLPRFVAYARLIASARNEDGGGCASLHSALAAATAASEPFLRVLAHLALAACQDEGEPLHLAEAAALADAAGAAALTAALGAYSAGREAGMLGPFVRRFRAPDAGAPLVVEIATASVRRGDACIAIPERELALLLLLAGSRHAQPAAALADALWPELDEAGGVRALQTCAYRVRRRLAAPDAVAFVAQGYRLGTQIGVDLDDAERELRASGAVPSPLARLRYEQMAAHFAAPRPAVTHAWEWYDPLELRVAAAAREVRRRLAADALERGDHQRALRHAQDMLAADDLDEGARDIALRVHSERADAPEGLREARLFDALLARDDVQRERPVSAEREAKTSTNGSAARP